MSITNKEIVVKVNEAFNQGDMETFLDYCTTDVQWIILGMPALTGKDAIRNFNTGGNDQLLPQIAVKDIIAEGDLVACDGTFKMPDKNGDLKEQAFCDVYRFTDGKIHELSSYVVKLKQ